MLSYNCGIIIVDNSNYLVSIQGAINMNRNGNFCKGTWIRKVIAETKVDARVEQ